MFKPEKIKTMDDNFDYIYSIIPGNFEMKETIFLIDALGNARINAPADNYVEIQRVNLDRQSRSALFQHPNSEVVFSQIKIGSKAEFTFETGIAESVWERFKGIVMFSVSVISDGATDLIFESSLAPLENPDQRKWHPYQVHLERYSGKTSDLVLSTKALHSSEYAWAVWGEPRIIHEISKPYQLPGNDDHHHFFIITADAMSKRFFGCYGAEKVKTPNIDRLAEESIICEDAWSNSTTTPGSMRLYGADLHPASHHLNTEWGVFPPGVASLPVVFNGHGYHTVMFAGEAELSRAKFGFSGLFNEVHGAVANPAQDGAVTVRTFSKWLQKRPDKPLFCWLQFFDTHPPNIPPGEYSRMYYSGNPEKIINDAETVRKVFGIETMVEFNRSMPLIIKGRLPAQPKHRFIETARAFQGLQPTGPDLYEHLKNLPKHTRLGMSDHQFGRWLEQQVMDLEENHSPHPDFIQWLELVKNEMEFIQSGIISWLKNVTDFDYPVSQYQGCMTYFDSLVGELIDRLKEEGIYDNSTIVIVSPHGEMLKYDDAVFHHHYPHPHVLSIPLILKTAGQKHHGRLKGIFNLTDLFPTLQDLAGINSQIHTDGTSRFEQIKSGKDIPESYSYAFDISAVLKSVVHPPYFYIRADEDFIITPTKFGKAGDEFLFELSSGDRGIREITGNEEMKAHLRQKLTDFLQR